MNIHADISGTNEVWLPVPNTNGKYEVSNLGNVDNLDFRGTGKRVRCNQYDRNGYGHYGVVINAVSKYVHDVVLEAFAGPKPPGMVVRHLNDQPGDNRWPENLAYGTQKENISDGINNGTINPRRPVDCFDLSGKHLDTYESITEAAKQTSSRPGNISLCCQGKRKSVGNYQFRWAVTDLSQEAA